MRIAAPLVLLVAVYAVAAWFLSSPRPAYVPLVSVRDLLNEPDVYHGHVVRVRVSDMIAGPRGALEYHREYGTPLLVVSWAGDPPHHRPASVVGTFRNGSPATLTDCRPAR